MKLVIAEKPSVAAKIASVIGATKRTPEWFEGNGYWVTWMLGHLLELSVPEAKGAWKRENLPIIPQRFELAPIKPKVIYPNQRPRLDVIKELFNKCDRIIVATDAEREGELIFRNAYEYCGCRKPFDRLWISSLTDKAIEKGFKELRPGREFDNLAIAAAQRNQADWIVGINATRAMSVACGCNEHIVLSLGRVQTPTLCMICMRYIENVKFKPEKYWFLEGSSVKDGVSFKWRGIDRYQEQAPGVSDRDRIRMKGKVTVTLVKKERVTEAPPLLFDIDALQKAANSRYGYTLDESLALAQALYMKGVLSYPRTASRYISEDVFEQMPSVLKNFDNHPVYGETVRGLLQGNLNKRSVNDKKLTDHHAIIITDQKPSQLSEQEQNVYDLVLVRCLEAFSPECIADKTRVELESEGVKFFTSGRKEQFLGWRSVSKLQEEQDIELNDVDEIEMSMRPLPEMKEGDVINIASLDLIEDQTKPKPLLTDATLLSEMENAGKKSDDKAVVDALRNVGIGTAATRAEALNKLVERKYVKREKKKLLPTDLGLEIFVAVRNKAIANVEMTARWEMALNDIEEGKTSADGFADNIKTYARKLTEEILKGDDLERLRRCVAATIDSIVVKCPKCGKEMRFFDKSVCCTDNENCKYRIWRDVAGKKLSDTTLKTLIKNKETGILSGFKSKSGKDFSARLVLEPDGKVKLAFEQKK